MKMVVNNKIRISKNENIFIIIKIIYQIILSYFNEFEINLIIIF